ncbi:MAG TPA: hypothetical protein VIH99_06205, partial [Bdellovibrionota bacterium]
MFFTFTWQFVISLSCLFLRIFPRSSALLLLTSLPFALFNLILPAPGAICELPAERQAGFTAILPMAIHHWESSFLYRNHVPIVPAAEWFCENPKLGISHAHHKTGPLGLRGDNMSTPVSENQSLLFALGCSITYGAGVGEESTLPAQLASASKDRLRVLNFGVNGGGLQNAMAALADSDFYLRQAKARKPPVVVY